MCVYVVGVEATHTTGYVWRAEYNLGCWSLTSVLFEIESLALCCAPWANWLISFLGFSFLHLLCCLRSTGITGVCFWTPQLGSFCFHGKRCSHRTIFPALTFLKKKKKKKITVPVKAVDMSQEIKRMINNCVAHLSTQHRHTVVMDGSAMIFFFLRAS